MTIQANNETIKALLRSNALARNYLKEYEYELLFTLDTFEIFSLNYLCPFCDKVHTEDIKGIKLTDTKFIICTHPAVLTEMPYLILGFVLNHQNNEFTFDDMVTRIINIILPSLSNDDIHENTYYSELINTFSDKPRYTYDSRPLFVMSSSVSLN